VSKNPNLSETGLANKSNDYKIQTIESKTVAPLDPCQVISSFQKLLGKRSFAAAKQDEDSPTSPVRTKSLGRLLDHSAVQPISSCASLKD